MTNSEYNTKKNVIEQYRHSRHHHHKKKRSTRNIFIMIVVILACVAAVAIITWRVMDYYGLKRLKDNTSSDSPVMLLPTDEESQSKENGEWKDGWVRYKGSIYEYNSDIMTFLFMGIDSHKKVAKAKDGISGGQADTIFLLIMNPDDQTVKMMAINRNTMTDIDVYDKSGTYIGTGKGQICLSHGYGDGMQQSCERTEKAVSNLLYSLPINGYCSINMGCIPTLNDSVGGVTVNKMTYSDGKIIKGDTETLYGKDAYKYLRQRGEDFDSASYRLEKQKVYINSFMKKLKIQVKNDPRVAISIYKSISPYVVTDVDMSEITYLADNFAKYQFDSSIYSMQGTVNIGKTEHEEFTYDEDQLYGMMIDLFYKKVK